LERLYAGAAKVDISISNKELDEYKEKWTENPHKDLYPGGTISPIYARVLITRTLKTAMVLISMDLVCTHKLVSDEIRMRISKNLGIGIENISVCTSQNHSALYSYPKEWSYTSRLIDLVEDVANKTHQKLEPAFIGAVKGYCFDISYNYLIPITEETPRCQYPHEKHKGGMIFARDYHLGRTSGRPFDSEVGVIRVDKENGVPLAVVFNFSSHPATTIEGDYMHGDYSGFAADEIEAEIHGVTALFTQGSLGNGNSIPFFGTIDDAKKSGHKLAKEVLRVLPDVKTASTVKTAVVSEPFLVTHVPFSTQRIVKIKGYLEEYLSDLEKNPDACWIGEGPETFNLSEFFSSNVRKGIAQTLLKYCNNKLLQREKGVLENLNPLETEIQVFRWNDIVLCMNTFEMFYQTGLEIKRTSPFRYTFPVGNANFLIGYVVPEDEFYYGGYCSVYSPMFTGQDGMKDPSNCKRIIERFMTILNKFEMQP